MISNKSCPYSSFSVSFKDGNASDGTQNLKSSHNSSFSGFISRTIDKVERILLTGSCHISSFSGFIYRTIGKINGDIPDGIQYLISFHNSYFSGFIARTPDKVEGILLP